jgi:hypothetical protein
MAVKLNHTIVHSVDPREAAKFYAEVFGLPAPDAGGMEIQMQHYAFLVSEKEFDQVFARVRERGLQYWADPGQKQAGSINHHFGGRGMYFQDPSGHLLEIITQPYGEFPK